MPKRRTFRDWMLDATPEQQKLLATLASTSRAYLYHLAAPKDAKMHREPGPELVAALEEGTAQIALQYPDAPEPVTRRDLSDVCAACPFANRK